MYHPPTHTAEAKTVIVGAFKTRMYYQVGIAGNAPAPLSTLIQKRQIRKMPCGSKPLKGEAMDPFEEFTMQRWTFRPDSRTVIQTDKFFPLEEQRWYLAYEDDGKEPAYHLTVEPTQKGVLWAIHHISEKLNVNTAQLLDAMKPVIRTVLND